MTLVVRITSSSGAGGCASNESALPLPFRQVTDHPRGEIPSGRAGDDNARIGPSHDQTGSQPTTEASQSDRTIEFMTDGILPPGHALQVIGN